MFLMDPSIRDAMVRNRRAEVEARIKHAVPWDPKAKWDKELCFQASTYEVLDLFPDLKPGPPGASSAEIWQCGPDFYEESPCGRWRYAKMTLRRGKGLWTAYGKERGDVFFDDDVALPGVFQRPHPWGPLTEPSHLWACSERPYMSMTPMEVISLRPGIRRAKGDVIIAGLGMGYQLIEVSKRKKVTSLRLIEISRGLVDWLFPVIEPHLGCEVEIIVGNVYEVLPELEADVALIDVFTRYGGNAYERDRLRKRCPGIGYIWAWGA